MKRTWRFWPALWLGKIAVGILKLLGKKGTTFPGKLALKIDPYLIKHLGRGYTEGIIIVTGTNGKTTTANLLAAILQKGNKKFSFNQAGANLVTGIGGAMLKDTRWSGKAKVRMALLEVDEATVPKLCQQITPNIAIITNFFRDQLDRYGELDTTISLVQKALPKETLLVLNADDPLVAQFGYRHEKAVYYGVERTPQSRTESTETREARYCPMCGAELCYGLFHYGQLGLYECPDCDFQRPEPQVLVADVRQEEDKLVFSVTGRDENKSYLKYALALQGYYNLYNALAALTAARCLGMEERFIQEGLEGFQAQPGRMEVFHLPEGPVTLTLVKNPTGFNQVIHTLLSGDQPLRLMIVINDLAADGRDISWLWDVNFELLAEKRQVSEVVCSGLRGEEMALRLKYAGYPVDRILIEHETAKAVRYLQKRRADGERVYILPTYTALFPLRDVLKMYQEQERRLKVHA